MIFRLNYDKIIIGGILFFKRKVIYLESSQEEILQSIKEIQDSISEEQLKNADGKDLVEYLMKVRKLESLLMTIIDDYSKEIK